jgi:segregation and condensation protein A
VADQYLEYLSQKEKITLENLADFLTVASKLILIKSKALLPKLEFSDEEEKEIVDLEKQLAEFKKFKDISIHIGKMSASNRIIFSREKFVSVKTFFYPPENINVFDFKKYFVKVLSEIPAFEKLEEEMVREVITLEEKINNLHDFIKGKIETSFSELVSTADDKIDVIISFLAMLEMVKQKLIHVDQGELFSEIKLKHKEN